jgi:hypothetical protein
MKRLINGLFSSVPDAQLATVFLNSAEDSPPETGTEEAETEPEQA